MRTLLIDADDTLWENNIYYLQSTARLIEMLTPLGFTCQQVEKALVACEHETIPIFGYGPQGYVTALGMTCERLLAQRCETAPDEMLSRARACGDLVLSPPMVLLAGVRPTLELLQASAQLILVTKGDDTFQRDKLTRSGLKDFWDAVHVVPEKDASIYESIAAKHKLQKSTTWMVGNSPKSDINPAIQAGLGAIFIPHSQTWQAERADIDHPESVITLETFSDLTTWFEQQ